MATTEKILAIDPGNFNSAAVIIDVNTYRPLRAVKAKNEDVMRIIREGGYDEAVIEMVASYGMPVGEETFDTCVWIGRFMEASLFILKPTARLKRMKVKMNICNNSRARDSNITQALIDRFAKNVPNMGKGTKKAPGWFYGFKADIWQAYALGVTYIDLGMVVNW